VSSEESYGCQETLFIGYLSNRVDEKV